MIHITKAVVLLVSVLAVLFTAYFTISGNRYDGIYASETDSHPLLETAGSLLEIFVLLLVAYILTSFPFKRSLHLLGVTLYALTAVLAGWLAWNWLIPDHYSIACSYILVVLVAAAHAAHAYRQPPIAPVQSTAKRAPRARR